MKKLLFATALSLLVSSAVLAGGLDASEQKAAAPKKAVAAKTAGFDLMHPFWGPAQGQFASDTTYKFTRRNYEESLNNYYQSVAEKVLYGLTDNWTLFGSVGRNWSKYGQKDGWIGVGNNKSDEWSLGTSYNFINDGKNFLQGALTYAQEKYEHSNSGINKGYTVQGLYGYNLESFTPYVKLAYDNSLNHGKDNNPAYTATVAAYKQLTDKIGSSLGVEYGHPTSSAVKNMYTLTADTSYMITKDVAFRVFGDYLLHEKAKSNAADTQNKYSIGAGLKAAF